MSEVDDTNIGEEYHQATKYARESLPCNQLDWEHRPEAYKSYGGERPETRLPKPDLHGGWPLWDAIHFRRSVRKYSSEALSLADVSQLLWASQGVTTTFGPYLFRAAPSAGALYPIETYLLVNRVDGLAAGLYHYNIPQHSLVLLSSGELGGEMSSAALEQKMVERSAVTFIWTAMVERCTWKYGERAFRYIYMDAGHIAENLNLAAVSLDLGSCTIGAFFDDEVNRILGIDGVEETVVYMATVGKLVE
ncbi:MAG: SagB/ThcOx family dehydrogenase [Nitrospirota bacterium]|nr:SagB/ThcOx family dehydrogenase [Nitrospirota bacterium]